MTAAAGSDGAERRLGAVRTAVVLSYHVSHVPCPQFVKTSCKMVRCWFTRTLKKVGLLAGKEGVASSRLYVAGGSQRQHRIEFLEIQS